MKKFLDGDYTYYSQNNNGSLKFIELFTKKKRVVTCGETALCTALSLAGRDVPDIKGVQPEDIFSMYFSNPHNIEDFLMIRDLDYNKYPPDTVPQLYPAAVRDIIGIGCCQFSFGCDFIDIKNHIIIGDPIIACIKERYGGHYVTIKGFDDIKNIIYYDDPNKGYGGKDREISVKKFMEIRKPFKLVIKGI